ncbi:small RNA-binding protein 11, chloroplastic-like [Magnolia sinica]|uniref:small RNA-binding protein 11, chloroplastic-like n=1 Tax=Magnolia sinica TaxID=86752 RepID=UPI002658C2A2|nr:small RNA-binding protein 11, chloroplastic-like [Magnolia sinica]XP_058109006.1 small RNA-binding protein 11, chloroplastic-like [Magnolia sinica]
MAAFKAISRLVLGCRNESRSPKIQSLSHHLIFSRGIASKLFVGGLSFYTTDKALSEAFSQFGEVIEAKIVMDRVSDRSKGFGFITFASEDEAQRALREMNGKVLSGRIIFVDNAKARARFDDGGVPIARGPPQPAPNED